VAVLISAAASQTVQAVHSNVCICRSLAAVTLLLCKRPNAAFANRFN
jgi:hypothetical protein